MYLTGSNTILMITKTLLGIGLYLEFRENGKEELEPKMEHPAALVSTYFLTSTICKREIEDTSGQCLKAFRCNY